MLIKVTSWGNKSAEIDCAVHLGGFQLETTTAATATATVTAAGASLRDIQTSK
jgi:hypothetical protein